VTDQDSHKVDDLFFGEIVTGYTTGNPRFLRRDWLAAAVDEQLQDAGCRFVLLTAEPNFGKSVFMAQLAADHPDWPRYFIRSNQVTPLGDVGAKSFLLRIGYQLVALYPHLFTQERVQIAVEQRVGTAAAGSEVVGAEVKRLLASPFYQKALQIQQHVERKVGAPFHLQSEVCIGCGACAAVCPTGAVKIEDVDGQRVLRTWNTIVSLKPCPVCGQPFAPEPMAFLRGLVEASEDLWGICPACRRKRAAAQLDVAREASLNLHTT
jgi:ferredoxin